MRCFSPLIGLLILVVDEPGVPEILLGPGLRGVRVIACRSGRLKQKRQLPYEIKQGKWANGDAQSRAGAAAFSPLRYLDMKSQMERNCNKEKRRVSSLKLFGRHFSTSIWTLGWVF